MMVSFEQDAPKEKYITSFGFHYPPYPPETTTNEPEASSLHTIGESIPMDSPPRSVINNEPQCPQLQSVYRSNTATHDLKTGKSTPAGRNRASDCEIELDQLVIPYVATQSTEELIPQAPQHELEGSSNYGAEMDLKTTSVGEQKIGHKTQPPNYKPIALRWSFQVILLLLIAGVFAFFEYEMHRLPPVHFRLFDSGLTSPESGEAEDRRNVEGGIMTSFEKHVPNVHVAAPAPTPAPIPPVSLFPTPVEPVMSHCGWGVPEWGIALQAGFEIPRGRSFGDENYWFDYAFDWWSSFSYNIPTFFTDDESWCPCAVFESSLYGWGGGEHFIVQPEGADYSHDAECRSVISGILYHNFEYILSRKQLEQIIGAKAMSDMVRPSLESIASRYTTKLSAAVFITLAPPDSLAPTWAWPSTKPDGAVVLPVWRDESYSTSGFHRGDFEYDYFDNPITRDENGKTVATRPIFDYGATSGWQTPPAGLMWWTLPPSRSGSFSSTTAQTTTELGSGIGPISSSAQPTISSISSLDTTAVSSAQSTDDPNTATTVHQDQSEATSPDRPPPSTVFPTIRSGHLFSDATQTIPLPTAATGSSRSIDVKKSPKETQNQLHATSSQLNEDSDSGPGRSRTHVSSLGISDIDSSSGSGRMAYGQSESRSLTSMLTHSAQSPQSTVTAVTVVITTTYHSDNPASGSLPTRPVTWATDPSPPPSGIAMSRSSSTTTDAHFPTPPLLPPGAGPIPPGAEALLFNLRSSADFLMASLVPVLLTTLLSMAIQVFCSTLNTLLPFRALTVTSHPRLSGTKAGAETRESLLLPRSNPSSSSMFHGPGVSWRFGQQFHDPLPAMNFLLSAISTILVPLSNEVIRLELTADCGDDNKSSAHAPSGGTGVPFRRICALGLRKQDTTMRVAESLLVVMAVLVMFIGYILLRWRSGVAADPWSISAMATLYSGSSQELRQIIDSTSINTPTTLTGCPPGGDGSTHRPLSGESKKALLAKSKGLRFRLRHQDGNSAYGIEILHSTIEDDKTPIKATTRAPREKKPIDDKRKKALHYFQWLSPLNPGRMSNKTTRTIMNTTALILTTALLVVILYYENTEVLPSESTGFESFMSGQSFAVRILFTALGTAITLFWDDYFSYISSTIIHTHLSKATTKPDFLLDTSPPAHIFDLTSIYRTMFKTRDWPSLSIALACFLAKSTPILLSNIPFRNTITWEMHEVCTWMAVGVLSYMVIVLGAHCLVPFVVWLKPFLPRSWKRKGGQNGAGRDRPKVSASTGMDNIAGLMYYSQVYYKDMVHGTVARTV